MTTFGRLLRQYRFKTGDPKNLNRYLTLERFVAVLDEESDGRVIYSHATIANWETGKNRPPTDDRELLVALLKALHKYGGISTLDEAKKLVWAGGFYELQEDEITQISEAWLEKEDPVVDPVKPLLAASHWLIFLTSVKLLFTEFRLPIYRPNNPLQPARTLERIFLLACWFLASVLIWRFCLPLFYWPPQDPLQVVIVYAVSTIFINAFIALIIWIDQRRHWPKLRSPAVANYLWTLIGALTGFHSFFLLFLAVLLIFLDFGFPGIGTLSFPLQFLAALPVTFFAVLGARQVPLELSRILPEMRFNRQDAIILISLMLIGPVIGWTLFHTHELLMERPFAGTTLVIILVLLLTGLPLLQQSREGSTTMPAFAWAIIIGFLWILYMIATGDFYQIIVVTISVMVVVFILWVWDRRHAGKGK